METAGQYCTKFYLLRKSGQSRQCYGPGVCRRSRSREGGIGRTKQRKLVGGSGSTACRATVALRAVGERLRGITENFYFGIPSPPELRGVRIFTTQLDASVVQQLRDSALPSTGSSGNTSRNDELIGNVIGIHQANMAMYRKEIHYPSSLIEWGKVQSTRFLGRESRGLHELDKFLQQPIGMQWGVYSVKQEHGTFLWLVGLNREGQIYALEGIPYITNCLTTESQRLLSALAQEIGDTSRPNHYRSQLIFARSRMTGIWQRCKGDVRRVLADLRQMILPEAVISGAEKPAFPLQTELRLNPFLP